MMSAIQRTTVEHAMNDGLFRPKIIHQYPSAWGGRDLRYCGTSEDGLDWALKFPDPDPQAPLAELFGYRVAEACGLAVPYHNIVELPGGGLAFGSRKEGGLETLRGRDYSLLIPDMERCGAQFSAAYALDIFCANVDRHPDNFLFRRNDRGLLVPMVIDYGSAWFTQGWPLPDIREVPCNTTTQIRALRAVGVWDSRAATALLSRVASISPATALQWLADAPGEWAPEQPRGGITTWWGGAHFHARLQQCMMFCS